MAVLKYIMLAIIIFVLFFPLYWMIQGSFLDTKGMAWIPPRFIPRTISFTNYKLLLIGETGGENKYVFSWASNSVILVSMGVALIIAVTLPAGYAFSVFKFKGRNALFWLFISATMLHAYMLIVPMFVVVKRLGIPLRLAAILPILFSPVNIFLAKNFIDTIPRSLLDSAELDGAGELRKIFSVVLPLCAPLIGILSLFGSISLFGDFLWQLLLFQQLKSQTLVVGLIQWSMRATFLYINQIGVMLAAGTILFGVMFVLFCFTSKYFTKGLNLQGVK